MAEEEVLAPSAPDTAPTRDQIRTAILHAEDEVIPVECFGITVEVHAPDLESLNQYRNFKTDDSIMARAIVNTVFMPGSDQPVFDEADIPELMKTKFSKDMRKLTAAVNRVLGGDEQILRDVDSAAKSD